MQVSIPAGIDNQVLVDRPLMLMPKGITEQKYHLCEYFAFQGCEEELRQIISLDEQYRVTAGEQEAAWCNGAFKITAMLDAQTQAKFYDQLQKHWYKLGG